MSPQRVFANASLFLVIGAVALGASACSSDLQPGSSAPASSPMAMGSSPMDMGSGSPMDMGSATSSAPTIHIKGHTYSAPTAVAPGAHVTVMNMDTEAHSVTANDGSFDVTVPAGQSVGFTAPPKSGTFAFHCKYHSDMTGTLVVG